MLRRTTLPYHLILLLSVPGLLVAGYLLLYHQGALTAVCTPSVWEDCGRVSGPGAPYAAVGPVPVALIGLVGYGLIFSLVWLAPFSDRLAALLPELIAGLTGLAFLFTLWLTALELFVLHAVCRYCLISAGLTTAMFGLAVAGLRWPEPAIQGAPESVAPGSVSP